MGSKTFRTLDDYVRHGTNIQVTCRCSHKGVVDAAIVTKWFAIHRWPRATEVVGMHMRCSACGQRNRCTVMPMPLGSPLTFPAWGPHNDDGWKRRIAKLRG